MGARIIVITKRPVKRLIVLPFLLLFSFATVQAQERYVTDSFEITLRTGMGTKHKILKTLRSGTRLKVLEVNKEEGYSRVMTSDGVEGWVITRYLMDQPAARSQLASLRKQLEKARDKTGQLNQQLEQLRQQNAQLQQQNQRLSEEKSKLGKELEHIKRISAEGIALHEENQKLNTQVHTLQRTIQSLEQENLSLKDRSARDWFLVGAAVSVFGVFLGLFLPNLRLRRRQSWSSL